MVLPCPQGHFLTLTSVLLILITFTSGSVIVKRDAEDPAIKILGEKAAAIPTDRYESDPILLQFVDVANGRSVYKDPQTEQEYYEHGASDKNKEAIVLTTEEDKLPVTGVKRVYVVMRQSSLEGKPKKYYPSIAYLVDPDAGHTETIDVKGKNYGIEWAVWNDGVLNGFKYSFQFAVCRYSVIIPCSEAPPGSAAEPASEGESKKPAEAEKAVESTEKVVFPPNEYSDFFLDLDNNKISGRFQLVGMAFDAIDKVIDGIGGLWCGLSAMILGQCHQYDPEEGFTKSQIGTPVVRSDGKVLAAGAHEGLGSDGILGTIINTILPQNKDVPTALMYSGNSPASVPPPPPPGYGPPGYGYGYGKKKRAVNNSGSSRPKGWRTQHLITVTPNSILRHEDDIFYGLGNCPYVGENDNAYDKASTPEEVLKFYVNLLRNGCQARVRMVIPALQFDGVIEISGKAINIKPGNPLINQAKLTWVDEQKVAEAFELHAISQTYREAREKPETGELKSPLDKRITRSVKFLESFVMNYISASKTLGHKHYIRLLRHLVQILRSALGKVGEDSRNLESCTGCELDIEVNNNDKLAIMSLIKFIMHGLPFQGDHAYPPFKEFVTKNQANIVASLKEAKL